MSSFTAVRKVPIEFFVDKCLSEVLAVSVYALMQNFEIFSAPFIPSWFG